MVVMDKYCWNQHTKPFNDKDFAGAIKNLAIFRIPLTNLYLKDFLTTNFSLWLQAQIIKALFYQELLDLLPDKLDNTTRFRHQLLVFVNAYFLEP